MTIVLCLAWLGIIAQSVIPVPEYPKEYRWNTTEEYQASEKDIEKCLKWLCNSPYGIEMVARSEMNAYVLTWIAGCPYLEVKLDTQFFPFLKEDDDLLFSMIHGMALYQLKHMNKEDQEKIYLEGLEVVADLVAQSESKSKEKCTKDLLKAHRRGKMKEYVKELLNGKNESVTEH
ncbi:MAG: hypothetical protein ACOYLH_01055 [Flavobacteriales bacterium]